MAAFIHHHCPAWQKQHFAAKRFGQPLSSQHVARFTVTDDAMVDQEHLFKTLSGQSQVMGGN
jgi:hypothetical protein